MLKGWPKPIIYNCVNKFKKFYIQLIFYVCMAWLRVMINSCSKFMQFHDHFMAEEKRSLCISFRQLIFCALQFCVYCLTFSGVYSYIIWIFQWIVYIRDMFVLDCIVVAHELVLFHNSHYSTNECKISKENKV